MRRPPSTPRPASRFSKQMLTAWGRLQPVQVVRQQVAAHRGAAPWGAAPWATWPGAPGAFPRSWAVVCSATSMVRLSGGCRASGARAHWAAAAVACPGQTSGPEADAVRARMVCCVGSPDPRAAVARHIPRCGRAVLLSIPRCSTGVRASCDVLGAVEASPEASVAPSSPELGPPCRSPDPPWRCPNTFAPDRAAQMQKVIALLITLAGGQLLGSICPLNRGHAAGEGCHANRGHRKSR